MQLRDVHVGEEARNGSKVVQRQCIMTQCRVLFFVVHYIILLCMYASGMRARSSVQGLPQQATCMAAVLIQLIELCAPCGNLTWHYTCPAGGCTPSQLWRSWMRALQLLLHSTTV